MVFPLGRQVVERRGRGAAAARAARTRARYDLKSGEGDRHRQGSRPTSALQKFYKDVLPADQGVARTLTYTRLAQLAQQANVKLEHGTNAVGAREGQPALAS